MSHGRVTVATQVADAIKERSERIYKKYGNVMLETEGMTKVRPALALRFYLLHSTVQRTT